LPQLMAEAGRHAADCQRQAVASQQDSRHYIGHSHEPPIRRRCHYATSHFLHGLHFQPAMKSASQPDSLAATIATLIFRRTPLWPLPRFRRLPLYASCRRHTPVIDFSQPDAITPDYCAPGHDYVVAESHYAGVATRAIDWPASPALLIRRRRQLYATFRPADAASHSLAYYG